MLPLLPDVERELVRYLAIRPDERDDSHRHVFLGSSESWGQPLSIDQEVHYLARHADVRAQALINCFKRYAPINQHRKRYLLTGDTGEIEKALDDAEVDRDTDPEQFLWRKYAIEMYELW
ncbi:hypothetical protein ACYJ1Y_02850 [Natrialbaceae archaeon A-gly3]